MKKKLQKKNKNNISKTEKQLESEIEPDLFSLLQNISQIDDSNKKNLTQEKLTVDDSNTSIVELNIVSPFIKYPSNKARNYRSNKVNI